MFSTYEEPTAAAGKKVNVRNLLGGEIVTITNTFKKKSKNNSIE